MFNMYVLLFILLVVGLIALTIYFVVKVILKFINKPKNKSVRRALAIRNGTIIMVQSRERESFHAFSQAMIDIGVTDAIYLVGGDAYGWYYNAEHVRHVFGKKLADIPENISYIVWR